LSLEEDGLAVGESTELLEEEVPLRVVVDVIRL